MTQGLSTQGMSDSVSVGPGGSLGHKQAGREMEKRDFDQETQELYLVFGGRVADPQGSRFADLSALDVRGIFATYDKAFDAWRARAQATVDDALMKYVIVRLR